MFFWRRLVVDEYTYNKERDHTAIVSGLHASARWVRERRVEHTYKHTYTNAPC